MKFLLLISLLFSFINRDHTREVALAAKQEFPWYGPATDAINTYKWTYLELPKSILDIIEWIQQRQEDTKSQELVCFGEGNDLIMEMLTCPDRYSFCTDSCFYYSTIGPGTLMEGVCEYSPQWIMNNYFYLPLNDKIYVWNLLFFPRTFWRQTCLNFDNNYLCERIKTISSGYESLFVINERGARWQFITIFEKIRGKALSFADINDISGENIYLEISGAREKVSHSAILMNCSSYLAALSQTLDNYMNHYPLLDRIRFIGLMKHD